jgi:arginine deiminase
LFNDIDTKRKTRVNIENGKFMSARDLSTIGVETKNGKQVICKVMNMP